MRRRVSSSLRGIRSGRLLPARLQAMLGIGVHFFLLLLFVSPSARPLAFPRPELPADAAIHLARIHQADRITSFEAGTAGQITQLTLRIRSLPPFWGIRAAQPENVTVGRVSRLGARSGGDPDRLRRHLSAGLLFPYRSTAPPRL